MWPLLRGHTLEWKSWLSRLLAGDERFDCIDDPGQGRDIHGPDGAALGRVLLVEHERDAAGVVLGDLRDLGDVADGAHERLVGPEVAQEGQRVVAPLAGDLEVLDSQESRVRRLERAAGHHHSSSYSRVCTGAHRLLSILANSIPGGCTNC